MPTQTPEQKAAAFKAAGLTQEQQTNVQAGVQTPAPLLVTSSQSRSLYNDNVNKMNTAVSGLTPAQTESKPPDTNYFIQPGESTDAYNSRVADYRFQKNKTSTTTTKDATGTTTVTEPDGTTKTPKPIVQGENDKTGNTGLDPIVAKQYNDSLTALDQQVTDAHATLDEARATMQNDPAMTSAVDSIKAKYEKQIELMKEKNRMLLGSYKVNGIRNGMMQYANDMETNFMSEEQDKANQRVSDLVAQEQSMILKTQQAFKSGDIKAFNAAQAAYDKANSEKVSALNKLLTATNDQIKLVQAQTKIDAANAKQKISDDIRISTNLGKSVADALSTSGIKDEAQMDAYVEQMATENGVSNPDILKSAVLKAQQDTAKLQMTADKTAASLANTENSITNRDKRTAIAQQNANKKTTGNGSTKKPKSYQDGSYTYTDNDVSTYTNFLNQGGTSGDGKSFNARGSDQFVDPAAYVHALNDWVSNGGTPQGFVKKFPVTNVNPKSYSKLPEAIRPAKKKTAA